MASELDSSKLHNIKGGQTSAGNRATAIYYVNVTETTTWQRVLTLARGAESPDDPVPVYGSSFNPGLDSQPADGTMRATAFDVMQRQPGPGSRLKWKVDVTYEPSSFDQTQLQLDISPADRDARFWTEQMVLDSPRDRGANLQEIKWPWLKESKADGGVPDVRKEETLGPITNAAGIAIGTREFRSIRLPVFVMKSYTLNPFSWIAVQNKFSGSIDPKEDTFAGKVNKGEWNVFNQNVTADEGTCLYLGIETSRPLYWGTIIYYELETRVLYNPFGHDLYVPNVGREYWAPIPDEQ